MMLKYLWQLPQNLLGYIVKMFAKAQYYCNYQGTKVYSWKLDSGLSLGKYIFIPYLVNTPQCKGMLNYIKHEYGHSVQSKHLGWFYLIVIGLPSVIWAGCFKKYRKKHKMSYYDFFTEKWADKLGGVNRA